jgi:hypothetical protein
MEKPVKVNTHIAISTYSFSISGLSHVTGRAAISEKPAFEIKSVGSLLTGFNNSYIFFR